MKDGDDERIWMNSVKTLRGKGFDEVRTLMIFKGKLCVGSVVVGSILGI
jgi:hypothetical protein